MLTCMNGTYSDIHLGHLGAKGEGRGIEQGLGDHVLVHQNKTAFLLKYVVHEMRVRVLFLRVCTKW